ncbi:proprotein convertase P-domain-containing protein [Actinosynnema sp. CS-041913]|uniref:proprotein convertase P-domain-containing protein n=1 Tax=Actinosynnema sp. CS-041913 TaxID=3239917 RepID=UPI003D8D4D64
MATVVAILAAACLTGTGQARVAPPTGVPAAASASAGETDVSAAAPASARETDAPAEASASARARATGEPVEVDALGTEDTKVVADPGGTFTVTMYNKPVRARTATGWAPIDTTLVARPDGTVVPKVSAVPVVLSGGGTVPLARAGQHGLDWDGPLPEPVLREDTATYPDVLPGVDLKLTATATGFAESVVVRDAQAARNPKLRELRFGSMTAGAVPAVTDVAALDDPGTTYPLSMDGPKWGEKLHWMLLSHNTTTGAKAAYWDSQHVARVGRTQGQELRWRSYYELNTAAIAGKHVLRAELQIYQWWAESCAPQPVELWHIGGIGPTTAWGDSTPFIRKAAEIATAKGFDANCPHGRVGFDIKDLMVEAANGRWPTTTVALKAREDATAYGGKEFLDRPVPELGLSDAVLAVVGQYNALPDAATELTVGGEPCTDQGVVVNSATPTLGARISDADTVTGQNIRGVFRWWEETGAPPSAVSSAATPFGGPGVVGVTVGQPLRDGAAYSFGVTAEDGVDAGPDRPWCRFTVDLGKPTTAPTVSSPDFPASPASGPPMYRPGRFTFSADGDPDVVAFRYGIGRAPVTPAAEVRADAPGGTAAITHTPDAATSFTANSLVVVGVDRAGNAGPSRTYQFKVSPVVTTTTVYAHWNTNSVTGGRLADSTGKAAGQPKFDATISGPVTSTRDRVGSTTGAVRFDGVSAHAATTTPVVPPTGNTFGSFTVMGWVKLDRMDDWATAVSQDGAVHSGFALKYNHYPRTWQFAMEGSDTATRSTFTADSIAAPQLGVWTHLAGVYDHGAGKMSLYVNGKLAGQADHTSTWHAAGPTVLGRAKYNGVPDDFWPGDLDEIQVYPWAASAFEVRHRLGSVPTFAPKARWALNEGAGQVAADLEGSGHTLALRPGTSWVPGGSGGTALRFDGKDGHANTGGPVAPRTADGTFDSFTVMGWVRLDELGRWAWAVSQDGRRDSGFTLGYSSYPRGWAFGMSGADADGNAEGGYAVADPVPQIGVWTHLAGVYDHAAGTMTLYVNGRAAKQVAHRSTWYGEGALQVGRARNDGWLTDFWPGEVDDVHLVAEAKSAADVRAAMAGPSFAPGARWALDDNGSDATGNGHTLALWPGASWSTGRFGSGLRLDGVEGHAYTAGPVVRRDSSFTVAAWVKLDAVDRHQAVVSQDGPQASGFRLHHDKDAKAWAFTIDGDVDGVVRGTAAPRAGEWTHLAGVYDATADKMHLFVNGRLQASATYTGTVRAEQGLAIGRGRADGTWVDRLAGSVDEVEVRDEAVKPEQVLALSRIPVPTFEQNQPTKIEDLAVAESTRDVTGLSADMLGSLRVRVKLTHTYRGDLVLRLVAPDGTEYLLEDLVGTGDVDDFDKTYPLNASGEIANGTWKLRVEDKVLGDTGTIDSWSISAPPSNEPVPSAPWPKLTGSGFTVGNNTTTERSVTVSGIPGNAPTNLNVAIDKTSSWAGDLRVSVVSPDGKEHLLHDGSLPTPPTPADACGRGGDTYDIKKNYLVNVSTAIANGVWKLRFKHTSSSGAPTVNSWSLSSAINMQASTTAPDTKFANPTDVTIDEYQTYSYAHVCGVAGSAARDLRVAVDVRHPNRGDLKLELVAAEGAATYLLEDVPDDDTGDNVVKTYQIPGVAQLANGGWELRVTDFRTDWVGVVNEWSIQLLPSAQATPSAGWKAENTADVSIVDDGWTESPVTVAGLTGMAPKAWQVSVDIKHTHRGDLALYLEAPDGTGYLLEDLTGTGDVDDLAKAYTVNSSAEIANGVWKLKVLDAVWGDVGIIDSWSLSAVGLSPVTTDVRVPVADLATADSPLTVAGATGNAPNGLHVQAAVTHPKPEQLVITLVAPDGTLYPLHDKKAVLPKLFRVDAAAEAANGVWNLRVQDTVSGEAGSIDSWGLVLPPAVSWPEQRGSALKVDGPAHGATGTSYARVAGVSGNGPVDLRLTVRTSYYWVSELKITLVAPDGTPYVVHDRADKMPETFTVDVSSEVANGQWKLTVQRNSSSGTVDITSWSLWSPINQQATPSGPATKFANGGDVTLPDDGWSSASSYAWAAGITGAEPKDVRVAVDIRHLNRGDLKLELRTPDGAATYLLEDIPDSDTGDNVFKTYQVFGVAQIVNGSWELVVTDTKTGNTGSIDGWSVQVLSAPQAVLPAGWRVENGTDTSIPDYNVVDSPITVSGLTGMAPREWDVTVALKHTYRGDLTLHLVAPDGTAYLLEDFAGVADVDDLDKTYTVNASSELGNGVWKLRVRDRVWGDIGHIDSWSLSAAPTGTPTPAVAWPEKRGSALKVDGATHGVTGTSYLRVAGVAGNAPADLRLTVATSYYWLSELKITLIAPDGTSYVVHDRADTMPGTFKVDASSEVANGQWKLTVQRNSSSGTVDITSWSLWSPINQQPTPPGPVTKFVNGGDVTLPDDGWSSAESYVNVTATPGNAPADLRVAVDVKHPNRGDLKLELVAPDGTAYLLEDLPNGDTGDNVFKSYQVNGSAETANGSWRLRVTDTVTTNTGNIDGWSLHFGGVRAVAPGARFENTADVPLLDNGTAESTVSIAGFTGPVPAGLRVGVVLRHPQRGDLKLDLVAPDGSVYALEDLTGSGNADDVVDEYSVNASVELASGTWRLRVADTALGDVGVIDSWSLTFPAPTKYHDSGNVSIADNGAPASSVIPVAGRTGNAPTDLRVVVDVKHANRGDLVLSLVAPDGTVYPLEDIPAGDTGDDVLKTYWVDASAEAANGGWALRAQDTAAGNTGLIDAWSVQFGVS